MADLQNSMLCVTLCTDFYSICKADLSVCHFLLLQDCDQRSTELGF